MFSYLLFDRTDSTPASTLALFLAARIFSGSHRPVELLSSSVPAKMDCCLMSSRFRLLTSLVEDAASDAALAFRASSLLNSFSVNDSGKPSCRLYASRACSSLRC